MEKSRAADSRGEPAAGVCGTLRRRPAARQRWFAALSPAHALENETRGLADRGGIQRLASFRGKCRLRRERNSPLDFRKRLVGSNHRSARSAFLQHRPRDVYLAVDKCQSSRTERQGPAHQRREFCRENAPVLRRETKPDSLIAYR